MGSNRFGQLFQITTWGESHGKAIGVVIDGCPAGLEVSDADINAQLALRRPGARPHTSPRQEPDHAEILSGVFEGRTTGAPLSIIIYNQDADSSKYEPIKDLYRPGHANFTYLQKYGVFDYRGGGRASARETACRVAAGAVAKKLLAYFGIEVTAYLYEVGGLRVDPVDYSHLREKVLKSPIFCPDERATTAILQKLQEKDSFGGIVEMVANPPVGLGDPIYEKLEANLAKAMLSLPASKGVEFGEGFQATRLKGSEHNDAFALQEDKIITSTNHAGGTLGGISTGMPLVCRVAFKPTASIPLPQQTLNLEGQPVHFELPAGSRHDPCVAIRAVPVVEAMGALVLADALLMQRLSRL